MHPLRAPLHAIGCVLGTLAPLTLGACLGDLPSPSRVDDLRILAVRAEPPEAPPGAAVALDALVVDPQGRLITYHWYACVLPESGQGFFGGGSETQTSGGNGAALDDDAEGSSCIAKVAANRPYALDLGTAPSATLPIPSDFFATDEPLRTAYELPESLALPPEVRDLFLGIAGVNYTVTLVAEVDGRRVEATKRVNVSLDSLLPDNARNLNPTDLAIHLAPQDDADDATPPTRAAPPADQSCFVGVPTTSPTALALANDTRYVLTPINLPDPRTSYVVLLAGTTTTQPFEIQTTQEYAFYSFFATVGGFQKTVSRAPGEPATEWSLAKDESGPADLWVVLRDGRGGVAWCHSPLLLAPP